MSQNLVSCICDEDAEDVKSYRPISNLMYMSKLIERMVYRQITTYLEANHLLPKFQALYGNGRTESTLEHFHRDGSGQHWPA